MIGFATRFLLFVTGYLPMYGAIGILGWERYGKLSLIPLAAGAVSLLSLPLILRFVADTQEALLIPAKIKALDGEALPYLLGYVVPFVDLDFSSPPRVWAMLVIFLTIGVTQVSANLIHLNPVLSLLGWHVYGIDDETGREHILITRRKWIPPREPIEVVTVSRNNIHWGRTPAAAKPA